MVETTLGAGKTNKVLTTAQVTAAEGARFEIKSGNEVSKYEFRPDGLYKTKSAYYVLKQPIAAGARWPIMEGRGEVRVEEVGATVTVPSGTFSDCIVVVEEVFQDQRVEWAYAPDVGPVRMRVFLLEGDQKATLIIEGRLQGHQLAGAKLPRDGDENDD